MGVQSLNCMKRHNPQTCQILESKIRNQPNSGLLKKPGWYSNLQLFHNCSALEWDRLIFFFWRWPCWFPWNVDEASLQRYHSPWNLLHISIISYLLPPEGPSWVKHEQKYGKIHGENLRNWQQSSKWMVPVTIWKYFEFNRSATTRKGLNVSFYMSVSS